jgi:glutathione S-transferase
MDELTGRPPSAPEEAVKLHWSPRSPFVRKVMIVVHELGLYEQLEYVRSVAAITMPNPQIMADNPLNKIPTLVLDDGAVLYDSRVICEYLAHSVGNTTLFPRDGGYFTALRRQALGDGLLDLMIWWRNEQLRPREQQSAPHFAAFVVKLDAVLSVLESEADELAATPFNIGHVAIGCALSYVDFRFAEVEWRKSRDRLSRWYAEFAARPSVVATPLIDDS